MQAAINAIQAPYRSPPTVFEATLDPEDDDDEDPPAVPLGELDSVPDGVPDEDKPKVNITIDIPETDGEGFSLVGVSGIAASALTSHVPEVVAGHAIAVLVGVYAPITTPEGVAAAH
jgi:hypothetical protein